MAKRYNNDFNAAHIGNQAALITNNGQLYKGKTIQVCHEMRSEGKCVSHSYIAFLGEENARHQRIFSPNSDHAYDMVLRMRLP